MRGTNEWDCSAQKLDRTLTIRGYATDETGKGVVIGRGSHRSAGMEDGDSGISAGEACMPLLTVLWPVLRAARPLVVWSTLPASQGQAPAEKCSAWVPQALPSMIPAPVGPFDI